MDNALSVNQLFTANIQYEVPRYQRRYVWDETNWRTLWEDIRSQQKLAFQDREHFTGTIVTRSIEDRELKSFEVIDGQQRLTTFQIIFCVIRDLCESKVREEPALGALVTDATNHIENQPAVVSYMRSKNAEKDLPDPIYKLIPTDYDKLAFQTVVNGEYGKAIHPAFDKSKNCLDLEMVERVRSELFGGADKVSASILDVYRYFYDQIRAYIEEDCNHDRVSALMFSIQSSFTFVPIAPSGSDQPEKIFESLNATGRMLSEFDYLRNNLFLRAGKLGKDEEDNSYSNKFYDDYWHFENDSQYWDAENLDSFFRAFLMAKLGPDCFEAKNAMPFELYREYSNGLTRGIEYEFQQLSGYARSYKEINESAAGIGFQTQFYKVLSLIFEDLNLASLQPFMLYLKHEEKLSDSELNQVFVILESYIVRGLLRNGVNEDKYICRKINDFFFTLINSRKSNDKAETRKIKKFRLEEFAQFLSKPRYKQDRKWPTNENVKNGLRQVAKQKRYGGRSLEKLVDNMLGYILYRIESLKRENMGQKVIFKVSDFLRPREGDEQFLKKHLSLQLLMPLSKGDEPKLPYSIGNLTLCKGYLTPQLSFRERKEILSQGYNQFIMLNQEICTEYKKDDKWNITQIQDRESKLLACFHKIWPPAERFIRKTSKPKAEPRWVSIIQPSEKQLVTFVTYAGTTELSRIETHNNGIMGIDQDNNKQALKKSNILFVCSATAWPEVEPHIYILPKVQKQNLQSPKYQNEPLNLEDQLLKSAQEEQIQVTSMTRSGHELEGTIEDFDKDAIYMQIREHPVIVYRRGLYEFATDEWHEGRVTRFNKAQGYGFISADKNVLYSVHINEVLDKNIRELELDQEVEFNINQTTKSSVAINVKLVETTVADDGLE